MDHTLREELAFDISLRDLGQCLAAFWAVRTLPKSVDQHYRQRALPDPIGAHLHPFVLKVAVDGRDVTVGITDCEMSPVNKKRKERSTETLSRNWLQKNLKNSHGSTRWARFWQGVVCDVAAVMIFIVMALTLATML